VTRPIMPPAPAVEDPGAVFAFSRVDEQGYEDPGSVATKPTLIPADWD
jgi:hypothetical protein